MRWVREVHLVGGDADDGAVFGVQGGQGVEEGRGGDGVVVENGEGGERVERGARDVGEGVQKQAVEG